MAANNIANLRRWTSFATATAVVASMLGAVTLATPVADARADGPVTSLPDLTEAQATAIAQGARVEVSSERTETSTTFANPDGTLTTNTFAGPVRVKTATGWVPVDTDLSVSEDRIEATAVTANVEFSAGGGGEAAGIDDGRKTLTLDWPGQLPEPTVDGPTASYALDDGSILRLSAQPSGYEVSVVLNEAPAVPPSWHLELGGSALVGAMDDSGGVVLRNAAGTVAFTIASARMWDAQKDSAGDPIHEGAVSLQLAGEAPNQELVVTPSAEFLNDPATLYPVTVDPTTSVATQNDTFVSSAFPDTNYGSDYKLRVGSPDGTTKHRSYVNFAVGMNGKTITAATLTLRQYYAATCNPKTTNVYPINEVFAGATWSTRPTSNTTTTYASSFSGNKGSANCSGGDVAVDVKKIVQGWADNAIQEHGLELRANDELDANGEKRFCSLDLADASVGHCTTTGTTPQLSVTYVGPPSAPTNVQLACTDGSAKATWAVPSNNGDSTSTNYSVSLFDQARATRVQGPTTVSPLATTTKNFTGLTNGHAYYFTIYAQNSAGSSATITSSACTAVPVDPPSLAVAAISGSSAYVSWQAPASTGNATLSGYTVKATNSTTGVSLPPVTTSATAATLTGLTVGSSYDISVTTNSSAGTTPTASATIVPAAAPERPTGVAVSTAAGVATASVVWQPAVNVSYAETVSGYTVTLQQGLNTVTQTVAGDASEAAFSGLLLGNSYTATVVASNRFGSSISSSQVSFTPGSPAALDAVEVVAQTASATANWEPPSSLPDAITVTATPLHGGGPTKSVSVSGSAVQATVSGLTNDVDYEVTATASNAYGTSSVIFDGIVTPGASQDIAAEAESTDYEDTPTPVAVASPTDTSYTQSTISGAYFSAATSVRAITQPQPSYASVTGSVINQATGDMVSGATVLLKRADGSGGYTTTAADSAGYFAFSNIPTISTADTYYDMIVTPPSGSNLGSFTEFNIAYAAGTSYEMTAWLGPTTTSADDLALTPSSPAVAAFKSTSPYPSQRRMPPTLVLGNVTGDLNDCNAAHYNYSGPEDNVVMAWRHYILHIAWGELHKTAYLLPGSPQWDPQAVKANMIAESTYAWYYMYTSFHQSTSEPYDMNNTFNDQCYRAAGNIPTKWNDLVDQALHYRVLMGGDKENRNLRLTQFRAYNTASGGANNCPSYSKHNGKKLGQFATHLMATGSSQCPTDARNLDAFGILDYFYKDPDSTLDSTVVHRALTPPRPDLCVQAISGEAHLSFKSHESGSSRAVGWKYDVFAWLPFDVNTYAWQRVDSESFQRSGLGASANSHHDGQIYTTWTDHLNPVGTRYKVIAYNGAGRSDSARGTYATTTC